MEKMWSRPKHAQPLPWLFVLYVPCMPRSCLDWRGCTGTRVRAQAGLLAFSASDGKPAWLACGRVGGAMLLPLLLFAIWPGTEGRLRRSIASFSVLLAVKVQRCGGFSETKRSLDPWDISALGTATSSLRPGRRSLLRARSSPISTLGPRCSCQEMRHMLLDLVGCR